MSGFPVVSVVIPAYNHERFVGEAIDSVLAQTISALEVIVVDDGSRDNTAVIADGRAAADPRVRVLRQSNGGSHAAINRGLAECRAEWMAILNSDDRWAPRRLERLLAEGRAGASFVVTGTRLVDAEGAEIADKTHWWLASMSDFRARARELGAVQGLLYGNYTASTSNFFFSRALARAIGPLRALRFVPDWDWALRAALHDPEGFRFLADAFLLDYRLHGSNAILGEHLLGDCEINRMHRRLLMHLGTPSPLVSAVFRNQRDLRRNWRARGVAPVEQLVREREADVATLRAAFESSEAKARSLEVLAIERLNEIERQGAELDEARGRQLQLAELETRTHELYTALGRAETLALERLKTMELCNSELAIARTQLFKLEDLEAEANALRAGLERAETLAFERLAEIERRTTEFERLSADLAQANALVSEAQSSFIWRVVRKLRRSLRIGWF